MIKILIYMIFATTILFAKISSQIENVGSVSISDISPNVAVVDEGTTITIKGSGFTSSSNVVITADSTHESLKINTLNLGSSVIAQETYIYENKLYVGYANDGENQTAGILVYDLSTNQELPTLLKDNTDLNLTYISKLSIYDEKLYVADGEGLFTFNIATDGTLTSSSFYETIENQAVKDIEFTSSNIIISTVDFSDIEDDNKSSIIFLNNQLTQDSNFSTGYSSWAFEVDSDNNSLYIANGDKGVVKTSLTGTINDTYSATSVHDIVIKDDYIYVAKLDKGIDILNKSDLTKVGTTFTTNGKSIKMIISDNKLVVANKEDGVLVLDISTPTQLKEFAKFNASGDTTSVDIYNGYSYSANGFNGVVISDITKPNSMEDMVYNTQKVSGKTNSVLVDGNTTYFTYTNSSGVESGTQGGIVITDLSNLQKPEYKKSFKILDNVNTLTLTKKDINGTKKENLALQNVTFDGDNNRSITNANQVLVQNGLAYTVDDYGLIIYDLDNNISLGSYRTFDIDENEDYVTSSAKSIQIVTDISIYDSWSEDSVNYSKVAVVGNGWGSVALLDISDSSSIEVIYDDLLAEAYENYSYYYSIYSYVKDGTLYIATYQNQIIKIDLSTLDVMTIDFNLTKQQITSFVFDNNYTYVSAGYDGVFILDENNMYDENNKTIILGSYDTPDFVWFTKREGDLLYVADSYDGIIVLDISDKSNPVYLDTIKISGDVNNFDFLDAAMVVSSKFGGVVTIDKYLETNTTLLDNNTLEITFPDYKLLGDYNLKVMNDNNNYSRVVSSVTLISEAEKNTMPTLDLQLRTKDGLDGEVVIDGQNMVILNALLSYDNTITNIFKELTTSQYQLTSSDNSIAQVYGNKIVFYNNGEVTITISAKGLSDSINFKIQNIEPIETSTQSNIDKLKNAQAVIVVGHIDPDNLPSGLTVTNDVDKLRFSINKIGNSVYKTLTKFGLKSEDIFYFNPNGAQTILDINNDKVKDDVTYNNTNFSWSDVTTLVDNLENNSSRPLIFYMVDHGDENLIKVAANKDVSATDIKSLFDTFQTNTNRKIVAVFDACYSGSIFDDLNNNTYGDRVIISSADASNPTYMDPFGISFSKYFLSNMKKGDDLNSSFTKASESFNKKLFKYGVSINPQYYSNSTNQQKISDYAMVGGFPDFNSYTAKDNNLTYVVLNDKNITLDVNISVNYPTITKAYALILPPTAPQNVGTAKVINSEKVELVYNSNTGLFSGNYTFDTNGTYAINYLVEDDEDNMILSDLAYITIDKSVILTKDSLIYPILISENSASNTISSDLNLSSIGLDGSTISWSSSNTTYISNSGVVTQPTYVSGDKSVTLTATISSADKTITDTKSFDFTVLKANNNAPTASIDSIVALSEDFGSYNLVLKLYDLDNENLTVNIELNSSEIISLTNTTYQIIPSQLGQDINIPISSIVNKYGDTLVTITVNDIKDSIDYNTTIKVGGVLDPDEEVALVKTNLTIDDLTSQNSSELTSNLNLPTNISGATILWSSSNTTYISNDGVVVQPVYATGDKTVTLTATITSADGTANDTKSFNFTVLKANNNIPTISVDDIISLKEDFGTYNLVLNLDDNDNDNLTVTLSLSDDNTISLGDTTTYIFSSSKYNSTIPILSKLNQYGDTTLTISVNDGATVVTDTTTIKVASVLDTISLSNLSDQNLSEGFGEFSFDVDVTNIANESFSFSLTNSNENLVSASISQSGTLSISSIDDNYGEVTISVNILNADSNIEDTKSFKVNVNKINEIPVTSNYSFKLYNSDFITKTLEATDGDKDSITFTKITDVSNGTLVFNNGTFTYSPNSNFVGIDKFTFKVSDSESSSSIKTVNLIVSKDNNIEVSEETISKKLVIGWNLVGLDNINILQNSDIESIFTYSNGLWSSNILENKITTIFSNTGYWVNSKKDISLELKKDNPILDISKLTTGWNLVSSATITNMDIFKDMQTIWAWNNITQTWKFYSKDAVTTQLAIEAGYESLSFIDNYDGFWVYK